LNIAFSTGTVERFLPPAIHSATIWSPIASKWERAVRVDEPLDPLAVVDVRGLLLRW
jgi:hypothetical protein